MHSTFNACWLPAFESIQTFEAAWAESAIGSENKQCLLTVVCAKVTPRSPYRALGRMGPLALKNCN